MVMPPKKTMKSFENVYNDMIIYFSKAPVVVEFGDTLFERVYIRLT